MGSSPFSDAYSLSRMDDAVYPHSRASSRIGLSRVDSRRPDRQSRHSRNTPSAIR